MKIKLAVSAENYDSIALELSERGIEVDDGAELILTERGRYVGFLSVRETAEEGARVHIGVGDIVAIEAFGHTIEVRTERDTYQSTDRLYQLEMMLDPTRFVRVSNSVIVNRKKIREIRPTFSQKFILTMRDGSRVDVTRSYYGNFKKVMDI